MAKELRLWNGRPYGVLPQSEWKHASVCVAAYSIADARRVCVEAGMNDPGANEVTEYWSECWGNDMNGIAPERGIWVSKGGQAKKLPSNALAQADAERLGDGPRQRQLPKVQREARHRPLC